MAALNAQEKDGWQRDEEVSACNLCSDGFSILRRKHHCRNCGLIFCDKCSSRRCPLPSFPIYGDKPQRVCDTCFSILAEGGNTLEAEVMTVRYFLRQLEIYHGMRPLLECGSRNLRTPDPTKTYFLVKDVMNKSIIMTLMEPGPACILSERTSKETRLFREVLLALKHPYVWPTDDLHYVSEKKKFILFRPYSSMGSLRDLIHKKCDPSGPYRRKYSHVNGDTLSLKKIALYGRQILEAMAFFRSKGLSFPHLHAGNVIVLNDNQVCITDYELMFLGLPPLYHFPVDFAPAIDYDMLAFARLLYEMAHGYDLESFENLNVLEMKCPSSLREVIRLIVSADNPEPPTVESMLLHPFFSKVTLQADVRYLVQQTITKKQTEFMKVARKSTTAYLEAYRAGVAIDERHKASILEERRASTSHEVTARREEIRRDKGTEEPEVNLSQDDLVPDSRHERSSSSMSIPSASQPHERKKKKKKKKKPEESGSGIDSPIPEERPATAPAAAPAPPPPPVGGPAPPPPPPPADDTTKPSSETDPGRANLFSSIQAGSFKLKKVSA